jgi:hypothetical protein
VLRPGDMVLACPPVWFAILALARHYLPPGPCPGGTQPLGKIVLAVGGDWLDVEPHDPFSLISVTVRAMFEILISSTIPPITPPDEPPMNA